MYRGICSATSVMKTHEFCILSVKNIRKESLVKDQAESSVLNASPLNEMLLLMYFSTQCIYTSNLNSRYKDTFSPNVGIKCKK